MLGRKKLRRSKDRKIFKKTANRTRATNLIGHGFQRGGRRF